MCLYPRIIENRKYRANKKNNGIIPEMKDHRTKYVPIGCQTCKECRDQKKREWQARLNEEIKHHTNGKFITLTFNTESLNRIINGEGYTIGKPNIRRRRKSIWNTPYRHKDRRNPTCNKKGYDLDNEICTKAVRNFMERWRKKYGTSCRHWLITELGTKGHSEHVHLHGIIWANNEQMENLEQIWNYGFVWRGYIKKGKRNENIYENYVSARTVNYMIKYVTKIDYKHLGFKPKILTSPGIGSKYNTTPNKFNNEKTNETYRLPNGCKVALPIYWRNKSYTDAQKEILWIQRLDKKERWVCGEKINVADNENLYDELRTYHQIRTMRLGYPPPEWIWKAKIYEEQRRTMMQQQRLIKAGYIT